MSTALKIVLIALAAIALIAICVIAALLVSPAAWAQTDQEASLFVGYSYFHVGLDNVDSNGTHGIEAKPCKMKHSNLCASSHELIR